MTRLYNGLYDAYYDPERDVWLEPVCNDPECSYCKQRPERPSGVDG